MTLTRLKTIAPFLMLLVAPVFPALADSVSFTAEVDRNDISRDESVSLKFRIQAEGARMSGVEIRFDAPDFDEVNSYDSSFVESYYQNGSFGVRNNRTITKVLRPSKEGLLDITGIQATINGQVHTAPSIQVNVAPPGGGTPPPRGYSGGAGGLSGGKASGRGPEFFVRAEISKPEVYKGEQLVVSYYLYRQVRVFNIQVVKYPVLTGFLREELEMPIQGRRLDSESVVLNGVPYQRSLLVRYAAYPLKEGDLRIDPMSIKANYYPQTRGVPNLDEDDPLAPFQQFFQQLDPRTATRQSKGVPVKVKPLPLAGRPSSFTGAVGDFDVVAAVDRYQVRVNEPVTLTVKIEGRGNTASISDPNAKWPSEMELYETKKNAKNSAGGVGEKVFEYLLIPRSAGEVELPGLEFGFFDPAKEEYVVRTTSPMRIQVLPSATGATSAPRTDQSAAGNQAGGPSTADRLDLRYLKPPAPAVVGMKSPPWFRWAYAGAGLAFLVFLVVVGRDFAVANAGMTDTERSRRTSASASTWKALRSRANFAANSGAWNDVVQVYDSLSMSVLDELDRAFSVGARSRARVELESVLLENGKLDEASWRRISDLLEYAEAVRYAASAGVVSEADARARLKGWVDEGAQIADSLSR